MVAPNFITCRVGSAQCGSSYVNIVDSGTATIIFDGILDECFWSGINWVGSVGGDNKISFRTRTGPTSSPDEDWSSWSDIINVTDGSGATQITSPGSRYIQVEAVITHPTTSGLAYLEAFDVIMSGGIRF